jgi:hypothetical protein
MTSHRYILEKYNTKNRFQCPACGHRKEFTRYIDSLTTSEIADHVGICNRRDRCGYHFTPKQFFEATGQSIEYVPMAPEKIEQQKELFTISIDLVTETLCRYGENTFVSALARFIGTDETAKLLQQWQCIGTSAKYPGAVIFWQIDRHGQVRTGKIMTYGAGLHRTKFANTAGEFTDSQWAHGYASKIPGHHEMRQCLFGEHQLAIQPQHLPIAICESEKTAIICSHFLPEFIWMAAGNLGGLNEYKLTPLRGRKVILYPDLGKGYAKWTEKAEELKHLTCIKVSDFLEKITTPEQRAAGLDLADYLLSEQPQPVAQQKSMESGSNKGIYLTPLEAADFQTFCASIENEFKTTVEY